MKTHSKTISGVIKTFATVSLLALTLSFTDLANAAGGCGFGYHRTFFGGCRLNHPGPWARPAPYHPGCWRNAWGKLRCYRY